MIVTPRRGRIESGMEYSGVGRTSHLPHVSGLVRRAAIRARVLDKDMADERPPPLVLAVGLAWEDWLAKRVFPKEYPGMIYHPGKVEHDGVVGSPDGIEYSSSQGIVVHEVKWTWKSAKRGERDEIQKEVLWWWQLGAYCHMLRAVRGELHVLWINGGYEDWGEVRGGRKGPNPEYMVYEAEWRGMELRRNWEMLKEEEAGEGV